MGSGPIIISALCTHTLSKNTVLSGKYPNDRESQQTLGIPCGMPPVSYEALKLVIDRQPHDRNTIFVSSWEAVVGGFHGWIGIWQKLPNGSESELYYNVQAPKPENIAELGFRLLLAKGKLENLRNLQHIDQIIDADGNSWLEYLQDREALRS